jgi:hypothetical protein
MLILCLHKFDLTLIYLFGVYYYFFCALCSLPHEQQQQQWQQLENQWTENWFI